MKKTQFVLRDINEIKYEAKTVDEIDTDVDDTKYNKYFTQAANAVPVRMAILKTLINNNPK